MLLLVHWQNNGYEAYYDFYAFYADMVIKGLIRAIINADAHRDHYLFDQYVQEAKTLTERLRQLVSCLRGSKYHRRYTQQARRFLSVLNLLQHRRNVALQETLHGFCEL